MNIVKPLDVKLLLQTPRQIEQCRFAGAVANVPGDNDSPSARGDIQHDAAALFAEDGRNKTHEEVGAVEVDCDIVNEIFGVNEVELGGGREK